MTLLTTVQGKKKGFLRLFKRKKDGDGETIVESNKPTLTVNPEVMIVETVLPSTPSPTPKIAPVNVNEALFPVVKDAFKPEKTTWISRTNYFKEMSNWAFDVVDVDGSGCVDEKVGTFRALSSQTLALNTNIKGTQSHTYGSLQRNCILVCC
jgi:hypothetical protein